MQRNTLPRRWLYWSVAALAVAPFLLVACGDDDDDDETSTATTGTATEDGGSSGGEIDYGALSGSIAIEGSSTVFPIAEAVVEEFSQVAGDVQVTVGGGGTGAGFETFCRGETQVANASRPIRETETADCEAGGIADILELQVAIDALTVVVNPDNDWATCMTTEQLAMAWMDGGATTWADINPDWPAEEIIFYHPGPDSGTFDYFLEAVGLRGADEEEPSFRSDGTASEDDNVLVQGVEGDKNAIGFFGFAYYQEAGQELTAVEIDDEGAGCVGPSVETALDGTYTPLSRPLYIYTSEAILQEQPEVAGYVNFFLDNTQALSEEVGYVPLSDDLLEEQQAKIAAFLP